jgi:MFS transporter, YNFM family, putative membrane transport protein
MGHVCSCVGLAPPSDRHGRVRRNRTAAVTLAGFCAFLNLYAPQPLLPLLAREFRTSAAGISLIITASTIAVAIAAPLAGILADHIGRKRVIVAAAVLLALPSGLAATATTLGQLVFWRFWQGIFTPGIAVVVSAYINEEWEEGVGRAMGVYVSGTVLGGFSGRMITGLIAGQFLWRWGFAVLGILSVVGGLLVWAWLPDGKRFVRAPSALSTLSAMARHMRNPRLLATYAVGFCVLFSMLATFTYVNFYLAAPPFGWSTSSLGLLFVVYLVGAVATPIAGRWIDRVGHRLTITVAFGGGVCGILLTLVPAPPLILVGLALCCSGVFIAQSASQSYIGTVAYEARAAALGLYVLFYYVGGSFGAAIPGQFWSRGGWPACVALIADVQVVTILLAALFWRPVKPARPVLAGRL